MFEGIVGQSRARQLLSRAVAADQVSHAYLFTGPAGIGKRSLARGFAKAVLCTAAPDNRPCGFCPSCRHFESDTHPDYLVIAPPENGAIKIDQVRTLISVMGTRPLEGGGRVCLIEDDERMTADAQNALLKSLEEPEPGNVFILTADNPRKLLPTIRSRCQQLPLEPLTDRETLDVLAAHDIDLTPEQQEDVLPAAGGLPGQALALTLSDEGQPIKTELLPVIYDILRHNPMPIFDFAEKAGKDKHKSLEAANWLMRVLVEAAAEKAGQPSGGSASQIAAQSDAGALTAMAQVAEGLCRRLGTNANPRLQWEAALLQIAEIQENANEN